MTQVSKNHPRSDPGVPGASTPIAAPKPRGASKVPNVKPNKPMKPQAPKKKASGGPTAHGGGGGGLLSKIFIFFVLIAALFFLSGLDLSGVFGAGAESVAPTSTPSSADVEKNEILNVFISVGSAILGIMLFTWFIKNKLLRK